MVSKGGKGAYEPLTAHHQIRVLYTTIELVIRASPTLLPCLPPSSPPITFTLTS